MLDNKMKELEKHPEKTPKKRYIYFYVICGHIFYWANQLNLKIIQFIHFFLNKKAIKNPNFEIKIVDTFCGGKIRSNRELNENISAGELNDQIIQAAEEGTPLVRLGLGNPQVMIIAGTHGNELSPQIAALKLINDLKNAEIKGTVYIVPFLTPASSAENKKLFNNSNLNLMAHIPGNPAHRIIELAKKLGVKSLADCHATSTDPAKDAVIYYPSLASSKIAVHINQKTGSTLLIMLTHPGMLSVVANQNKISAVICEVECEDGRTSPASVDKAYQQMMSFLDYHRIVDYEL